MATSVTQFGPIVNDVQGMGEVHELLGGVGSCRWKQVINGMHLNGPWNCVEYVVIPPGASCGTHTHLQTEEIYYILAGAAEMEVNGESVPLVAGDLVTASIGTTHGTVNRTDTDMEFLVVEVFPGAGESPAPVRVAVGDASEETHRTRDGEERSVDLSSLFTGPWRSFATIDIAPGEVAELSVVEDGDEVLFLAQGTATIEYGDAAVGGGFGLTVGIPPGATRRVVNRSSEVPVRVLSTIVTLG